MNSNDRLHSGRNRITWSRVKPDLPAGIHEPKLVGDIGWDVEAMNAVTIRPGECANVGINCRLALPEGFYADIRNRSSMSRRGLYVDQNLIDTGYRGELFIFLRNMKDAGITIIAGERIAQLVFHRVHPVWLDEIEDVPITTDRGARGFGSTGR